jgi:DNA polymerase-1
VHADYLQLGSRTGRMSCTKPNVQNLPRTKTYRGCITAEPGSCIVKADYSQIELRIAAVIAQDAAMLAAYQARQDLHIATAAYMLGVQPDQVTAEQRQLAKNDAVPVVVETTTGQDWAGTPLPEEVTL